MHQNPDVLEQVVCALSITPTFTITCTLLLVYLRWLLEIFERTLEKKIATESLLWKYKKLSKALWKEIPFFLMAYDTAVDVGVPIG